MSVRTVLDVMGAVGGAIGLLDRLSEDKTVKTKRKSNPRGRGAIPKWDRINSPGVYGYETTLPFGTFEIVRAYAGDWGVYHRAPGSQKVTYQLDVPEPLRAAYMKSYRTLGEAKSAAHKIIESWGDASYGKNPRGRAGSMAQKSSSTIRPTRNPNLGYAKTGDVWRFFDISGGAANAAAVGPHYRTKGELLADLSSYEKRAGWLSNPRGRSKRSVARPSQITGKRPTKRLVTRRKKTLKAPKGFYANPAAMLYTVHRADANGKPVTHIAHFRKLTDAKTFAQSYANVHQTPVAITRKKI